MDESDLWTDTDGRFVTTHLLVRSDYLEENPANVRALIEGLLDAIDEANGDAAQAQTVTNDGIEKITTKRLGDEIIAGAWENLEFTYDPVAASLQKSADDAVEVGLLDPVELDGIYDLTILNELLAEPGRGGGPGAVTTHPPDTIVDSPAGRPGPQEDQRGSPPAVEVRGVTKVFGGGRAAVAALDRVDLEVAEGELVCVVGASGCGKSTLLNLLAGLDEPTAGDVARPGPHRPDVPGVRPVSVADGGRQRRPGAQAPQGPQVRAPRPGRGRCSRPCGWSSSPAAAPTSCRAACASGSPWPGPSPRTPTCC